MDATVIEPEKHAAAANPATPLESLAELARESPELHKVVAANPSAYPALLDWMRELGEPELTAVIAQRAAGTPAPDATVPVYSPIAAPAASGTSVSALTADRRLVYIAGGASIALITVVLIVCGIVSAMAEAGYSQ